MKRIDEILQLREPRRSLYHEQLSGITGLILPAMTMADGLMSWFVYVVRLDDTYTASDRDRMIERLTTAGIGCARYFAPVHLQPSYSDWRFSQALPVTEAQGERTIALPFFNRITDDEVIDVCATLREALLELRTTGKDLECAAEVGYRVRCTALKGFCALCFFFPCSVLRYAERRWPQLPLKHEAVRINNIGVALMSQQLLEKAADRFDEAYKLDPSLAAAELNKAIALLYLQRLPEAAAALQHVAAQAPQNPRVWYVSGLLYRSENKPQESMTAFRKVLRLDPSNADSHYFLGSFLIDQQNHPAAEAEFRAALQLAPFHASALFGLARALQREGKTEEARAYFEALSAADNCEACFSFLA